MAMPVITQIPGILTFIRKRDGSLVPFDALKILEAMRKASDATPGQTIPPDRLAEITKRVIDKLNKNEIPAVEQVQDIVEETLVESGYFQIAKSYILYRAEHTNIRRSEADLMKIYEELTFASAKDADIKRENANIDADTAMGTMLKYGSEGSNYFVNNYILPKEMAGAHINGDIHIHDKDFYMLTATCCQIDLNKLFKNGFSTGHGYLREPNGIASYSALACIAIQANQNEMHGGQSIPNFDYFMAPGVAKTFQKEYRAAFSHFLTINRGIAEKDAATLIDPVVAGFTEKLTMAKVDAFGEVLLENESFLAALGAETIGAAHKYAATAAIAGTDRVTYQAMEALIHNLNTMNSRAGAQVPFSSINYGTDVSLEGRMVVKNLLRTTMAGLGNGETPIFPVQIFKVKEGINYNPCDVNYDLFELSIETSAKRLFPNFSFLDAPYNLQYYKEGDYNSEVAYMGCRTRVIANVHDRSKEVTCGRGNLSFTSINLPRIGIQAEGNTDKFYSILDDRLDLVCRQLLHRFGIQSQKKRYNYPFLMGQGVWIDSEYLGVNDSIGEVLKQGTLSIGFIGLAEALVALTGSHHGENEKSRQLGLEIISHMRQKSDEKSRDTGLNFTLLATPAEGLSGRFVRIDRSIYGEIKGVTDRDYYTNSFHVPVYYPTTAFKKLAVEAPYHAICNAGHISYIEMDGDISRNLKAFESVIRYMKESGIGYGSVNHPVDRDPVCGYTGVINDVCPRCGRREGEELSRDRLNELRLMYPDMPRIY